MEALLGLACSCSVGILWRWPLSLCCTEIFATQPFWKLNSHTLCTVTDKKYIVILRQILGSYTDLSQKSRILFFSKHACCWCLSQQQNWAFGPMSNLPHRPFPSTDTLTLGHNLLTYSLFTYSVSRSDYIGCNVRKTTEEWRKQSALNSSTVLAQLPGRTEKMMESISWITVPAEATPK
jgi:hypothetical protein